MPLPSNIYIPRNVILAVIVLLGLEALGMWLGPHRLLPVLLIEWLIAYHTIMSLLVSLTAAAILLRASRSDGFDMAAVLVFSAVLVVFNPLHPVLLVEAHAAIASLAVAACFVWALRRPSLVGW